MTYTDFMTGINAYYGDYKNAVKARIILRWLKSNVREICLAQLFQDIIEQYREYGIRPPDVNAIKEIWNGDEDLKMIEQNVSKPLFIDNPEHKAILDKTGVKFYTDTKRIE